jgi:hypothetical protein
VAAVQGAADGTGTGHPVTDAISALERNLSPSEGEGLATLSNLEEVRQALQQLLTTFAQERDSRILASSHKGLPTLLATVEALSQLVASGRVEAKPTFHLALESLAVLLDGQPDLVTPPNPDSVVAEVKENKNVRAMCQSLSQHRDDPVAQLHGIVAVKHACLMHEANRQNFVAEGLVKLLLHCIETHAETPAAIAQAAHCLRVLTNDDDVRVAFGKAHDHAKLIVSEHGALAKIMAAIKLFGDDEAVLYELCATLARLAVRNEYCHDIAWLGGITVLLPILDAPNSDDKASPSPLASPLFPFLSFPAIVVPARLSLMVRTTRQLVMACLSVVKAIAGNDEVKDYFFAAGGIPVLLGAMARFPKRHGKGTTLATAQQSECVVVVGVFWGEGANVALAV